MKIVLASGSKYRKDLLARLGIQFICAIPTLDEEQLKSELQAEKILPTTIAETLSYQKGLSIFKKMGPDALIISGDQLVSFEGQVLGKPLTSENAIRQLGLLNNKTHQLITALTVFDTNKVVRFNHLSTLKMKNLTPNEIKNYVYLDEPFDCSGSYKIEKHGIALFESIDCDDFTAIQGIPMLWLSNYLKGAGHEFFKI